MNIKRGTFSICSAANDFICKCLGFGNWFVPILIGAPDMGFRPWILFAVPVGPVGAPNEAPGGGQNEAAGGDIPPGDPNHNENPTPEALIRDLEGYFERVFGNAGRSIGEGVTIREYLDHVLWHGDDPAKLFEIWADFRQNGPDSELWRAAENLQRKYEHADRGEPDTPNPDSPPLVEDQKGAGEAGTSPREARPSQRNVSEARTLPRREIQIRGVTP